jgi:transposase
VTAVEAHALFAAGERAVVDVLLAQDTTIRELEARLALTSRNSSKPPSTDGFHKPVPKSLRTRSGLKPGGQPGHPGSTLVMTQTPDHIELHPVDTCSFCGHDLSSQGAEALERRQVFDIPPLPHTEITEHRLETKTCPICHRVTTSSSSPSRTVRAPVQYGPRMKALAVYLKDYQMLPFKRMAELMKDLFGCTLSEGTLATMLTETCFLVDAPLAAIFELLTTSPVCHFDETGLYVTGKRQWLHVAATATLTLYKMHTTRGTRAMTAHGLLPRFKGRAIHDFWKPYITFTECSHGLCNAHHLRELVFVHEQMKQPWAKCMIDQLLQCKMLVETAMAEHRTSLTEQELDHCLRGFLASIDMGIAANPPPVSIPGKRGRPKDSKAGNLVRRLLKYQREALAFLYDFNVPFTNNLAERDLRMMKVQQKVSGTFRSTKGGESFCSLRSYISTARKNGLSAFTAITMALDGQPFIPSH